MNCGRRRKLPLSPQQRRKPFLCDSSVVLSSFFFATLLFLRLLLHQRIITRHTTAARSRERKKEKKYATTRINPLSLVIFYSIYRETHRVLVVVASMCIYILLFYSTAIKGTGKPISCNIHSRLVFNGSYSGYMYLYYINFEWRLSSSTGLWWRSDESHQEEEENPARPRARKKKSWIMSYLMEMMSKVK